MWPCSGQGGQGRVRRPVLDRRAGSRPEGAGGRGRRGSDEDESPEPSSEVVYSDSREAGLEALLGLKLSKGTSPYKRWLSCVDDLEAAGDGLRLERGWTGGSAHWRQIAKLRPF